MTSERAEDIQRIIEVLLLSGKAVLLIGAPGVGKTRLAIKVSKEMTGSEPRVVVGRGDLSYSDLSYSYELREGTAVPVLGELAISILASWIRLLNREPPLWLLIDEVNRFNADLVLGDLLIGLDIEHRRRAKIVPLHIVRSLLRMRSYLDTLAELLGTDTLRAYRALEELLKRFKGLGYIPPPYSWRALATMNLVDRTHLHRLGFAFLRRFASVLFPSALREFRSSLRDVEAPEDLRRHVISIAAKEAYRELTLSSADIGIESDRSLYSATISERSIEEACRYYDRALRAFLQLAQSVSEIGVEIGYSAFVDVVKLLAVAFLIEFRDEALLADVAASSILLPHVGSVLPRMRAEVLLVGRSRRVEAFEKLVASVLEIFGEGSRSAYCCEVLSLELPQPIDMR